MYGVGRLGQRHAAMSQTGSYHRSTSLKPTGNRKPAFPRGYTGTLTVKETEPSDSVLGIDAGRAKKRADGDGRAFGDMKDKVFAYARNNLGKSLAQKVSGFSDALFKFIEYLKSGAAFVSGGYHALYPLRQSDRRNRTLLPFLRTCVNKPDGLIIKMQKGEDKETAEKLMAALKKMLTAAVEKRQST